jgi:hypothetical protein
VWPQFAQWLLVDLVHGVIRYAKTDAKKKAVQRVADLYGMGAKATKNEFREAAIACRSAYAYADADADAATYAAYSADAAAYAYAHADAAADAYAYADAAADAAADAYAHAHAADDAADARQKARRFQAEKLLKLLKAAPVPRKKAA